MRGTRWFSAAGIFAFIYLAQCALDASTAPPPPTPDGWETQVLPGFQPGIESTIIELSRKPESGAENDAWQTWEPNAADALAILYRGDFWRQFRRFIVRLLAAEPLGHGAAILKDLLEEALAGTDLDQQHPAHHDLINTVAPLLGADAAPLVKDSLVKLGGKTESELSQLDVVQAERMILLLQSAETPEAVALLELLASGGNTTVRWACIQALAYVKVEASVAQARLLLEETQDPGLLRQIRKLISMREPYARAQERMSVILEKERRP